MLRLVDKLNFFEFQISGLPIIELNPESSARELDEHSKLLLSGTKFPYDKNIYSIFSIQFFTQNRHLPACTALCYTLCFSLKHIVPFYPQFETRLSLSRQLDLFRCSANSARAAEPREDEIGDIARRTWCPKDGRLVCLLWPTTTLLWLFVNYSSTRYSSSPPFAGMNRIVLW